MRRNAIYGLQVLFGVLFVVAGAAKLAGAGVMMRELEVIGLGEWFRFVTGAIEVVGGLCLFVPRVALLGAVTVGLLMIGTAGAMVSRAAAIALDRPALEAPQPIVATTYRT